MDNFGPSSHAPSRTEHHNRTRAWNSIPRPAARRYATAFHNMVTPSPRAFTQSEWSNLSARLAAARSALAGVRDTVAAARRRNEAVAAQAVAAAKAAQDAKAGEVEAAA